MRKLMLSYENFRGIFSHCVLLWDSGTTTKMLLVDLALSSLWWFMTLHKGRWTEKKKGEEKFCSRIIGPSLQHKWGKSLWKKKRRAGGYRFLYYLVCTTTQRFFYLISVVLTVLIESKRQGGQIVSKEILFEFYYFPWDNFHLVFRYSPRSSSSLILVRPRNSLFIYDSG